MNLMVNQRIIKKIQRLAEDERGDPKTRAIAQRKLAEFRLLNSNLVHGDPRNQPNPRTQHSAEYAKFLFMNFDTWGWAGANRATSLMVNDIGYRVVIFPYKGTWGWIRYITSSNGSWCSDDGVFSDRKFATIDDARRDAWDKLMTL